MACQLIVALDTPDPRQASAWAEAVSPFCGLVKLGLEFFAANGPAGVETVTERPVFLDLKLHDIPNTVAGAVRSLLPLEPRMLTLHAGGGPRMIAAAREACRGVPDPPLLLAVTGTDQPGRTGSCSDGLPIHDRGPGRSAGADGDGQRGTRLGVQPARGPGSA